MAFLTVDRVLKVGGAEEITEIEGEVSTVISKDKIIMEMVILTNASIIPLGLTTRITKVTVIAFSQEIQVTNNKII